MPVPRSMLVDTSVTPWYHCISRCVRRAFLCGEGRGHRKHWIENRLKEMVELFAIECGGFSLMDNHLHLLLRIDSPKAASWSPAEVARAGAGCFHSGTRRENHCQLRPIVWLSLPQSKAGSKKCVSDWRTLGGS